MAAIMSEQNTPMIIMYHRPPLSVRYRGSLSNRVNSFPVFFFSPTKVSSSIGSSSGSG